MNIEITNEMKSTFLHFVIGALMGLFSIKLGRNLALSIGILIAWGMSKLSKQLFKHEKKWWMGNGLWPYLTAWIASWTIFLNM